MHTAALRNRGLGKVSQCELQCSCRYGIVLLDDRSQANVPEVPTLSFIIAFLMKSNSMQWRDLGRQALARNLGTSVGYCAKTGSTERFE